MPAPRDVDRHRPGERLPSADASAAPRVRDLPVSIRIELLIATLGLAHQEGTDEALYAASLGVEVLFDEGTNPSVRGQMYASVPPDLRETFCAAHDLIPRELRAKWKREMADGYEQMAREAEAAGDHVFAAAARANAAPQRRAARALAGNGPATPALRDARRTSTKTLNRALRDRGTKASRAALRVNCEHRNRRASGTKPVKRRGSRRTTAPTRGSPDDDPDGDLPPPAPGPGARWQALLGALESIDAALALPILRGVAR